MSDPKLLVLVVALVLAVFALAVAFGASDSGTEVPDPSEAGWLDSLRSGLRALPGTGTGRALEPSDLAGQACVDGPRLEVIGTCTLRIPDDVAEIGLAWGTGNLEVVFPQEDLVTQRLRLPRDLDDPGTPGGRTLTLHAFGGGGELTLACQSPPPGCLLLVVAPS